MATITISPGQKCGLDGKFRVSLEWGIKLDDVTPGMSSWERATGLKWEGIPTASELMAAAITSFLNNDWQDSGCNKPGCKSHLMTYWPCGRIPCYPEREQS